MKAQYVRWVGIIGLILLWGLFLSGAEQSLSQQGSPPEITFDIDFPSQILADGEKVQSFVFFKDPDKDIVQTSFELTKPQAAEPLSFDPQVKGKLSGVIKFTIAATSPPLELEICVGEPESCKKIQVADSAPAEVTFAVTLIDEAGNKSEPKEFSFKVEAVEKPNQPPVAKFSYSPAEPKVGEEVTFDASDSFDPDGEVTSYKWDFGDGGTGSGETVSHIYSSEGRYQVELSVTDDDGDTDSITITIRIKSEQQPVPPTSGVFWLNDSSVSRGGQGVYQITTEGKVELLIPNDQIGARTFGLSDIALDGQGQIFLLDYDGQRILQATPSGRVSPVLEGLPFTGAVALAIDPQGNFIIGDNDQDAIFRVTRRGEITRVANVPCPREAQDLSIAVDDTGNYIIATDCHIPNTATQLLKITPGGEMTVIVENSPQFDDLLSDIVIDPAGQGYFVIGRSKIFHISLAGKVTTIAAGFPGNLAGLTVDSSGDLFVVENFTATIYRVSPDGSTSVFVQGSPLAFPSDIEFIPGRQSCIPSLISPEEGAILDNGRTDRLDDMIWDFDWSDCEGATQYHLFVKHPDATIPAIDDDTIIASSYHDVCHGCYIVDRNRYGWTWKVRAKVDGQWNEWSETRTFDVEPVNTDPPS